VDHCNGLVLFLQSDDEVLHVCNPTTWWSARLPPCHAFHYDGALLWGCHHAFLVFDPSVSSEYKVLLSPVEPGKEQVENDDACRLMEWPLSAWATWHEFSSSTRKWVEKAYICPTGWPLPARHDNGPARPGTCRALMGHRAARSCLAFGLGTGPRAVFRAGLAR
jgi:hypothetical protein